MHFRQHREPAVQVLDVSASDDETAGPQTGSAGQARSPPLFNVMLTCYSLFERDSADQQADRSFLKKWDWSHLLLDEAHAVKNAMAMRTKCLTRYTAQSLCSRCLLHLLPALFVSNNAVGTLQPDSVLLVTIYFCNTCMVQCGHFSHVSLV